MDDRTLKGDARGMSVRDRRYCIRYPFAADVEMLDLESGTKAAGVTSDISMGGAFICTSRPFALNARMRITLKRKDRSEEHTSELQSQSNLVCRLLLEKKKK